ncbi:glycosyltransferase, partial [bacterium]|nr:glycosyltransferase [bacterium]
GSKIIFDQHDLGPELMDAKGFAKSAFFRSFSLAIERLSYFFSDNVISTNESYAKIAEQRGKKPRHKIFIVRSGPRRNWANDVQASKDFRKNHKFQLGYIGVMGIQDGVDLLLQAVANLVITKKLDVYLVLAGGGTELNRLKILSQQLGINNHVEFYGKVTDDRLLRNLIFSSDVCVASDRDNKLNSLSTMNKIIEYMALGRPMILFDSLESRYSAAESALYVEPENVEEFSERLFKLLLDDSLRVKLGQFGRERFLNSLAWENQIPNLIQAYGLSDSSGE